MTNATPGKQQLPRTVIEPVNNWFGINLKELWDYRELFWTLALREVQLRYRQTFLGVTWVVIQPLITTALFSIIFGRLIKVQSEDVSYALFAYVGLLPWNVFSQSLQRAGISLTRDIRLINKIFFPRIIIPMSNSASTLVDFFVCFAVLDHPALDLSIHHFPSTSLLFPFYFSSRCCCLLGWGSSSLR